MKVLKWAAMVSGGLVALGVVLYVAGLIIPVAHVASSSVRLRQPVDSIWRTVRALEESASWWPAVSAMERLPDRDGREVWLQRQTTGDLPMEVMESTAPVRLVMRIAPILGLDPIDEDTQAIRQILAIKINSKDRSVATF